MYLYVGVCVCTFFLFPNLFLRAYTRGEFILPGSLIWSRIQNYVKQANRPVLLSLHWYCTLCSLYTVVTDVQEE